MPIKFICILAFSLPFLIYGTTPAESSGGLPEATITAVSPRHHLKLNVQVAETEQAREKGLMYRKQLAPYDGMLFDFKQTKPVVMWMKNTPLPLDMLFIQKDGIIAHLHERAIPYDESRIASEHPVRYVLELQAGAIARYGLRTGDRIIIP